MNATGPSAGSAEGPPASVKPVCVADWHPPHCRELHEQIVRMLIVDERLSLERFADLKQLAIPFLADGQRVQAEHGVDREIGRSHLSLEHTHPPVRHPHLVASARPTLMVEQSVHNGVLHHVPAARLSRLRLCGMREYNSHRQYGGSPSQKHRLRLQSVVRRVHATTRRNESDAEGIQKCRTGRATGRGGIGAFAPCC